MELPLVRSLQLQVVDDVILKGLTGFSADDFFVNCESGDIILLYSVSQGVFLRDQSLIRSD